MELTSDCLYFTSSNSKTFVGQVVEQNITASSFESVALSGFNPSGIAVYKDKAFVASLRGVEYFSLTNLPRADQVPSETVVTKTFVDFAPFILSTFRCSPTGMRAFNDSLFIGCDGGIPYAVTRFSLSADSFGAFLGGVRMQSPIKVYDLLIAEISPTEAYLLFNDAHARLIYRVPLAGQQNGTLTASCFVCTPPAVPPNGTTEFRGMEILPELGVFFQLQVRQVSIQESFSLVVVYYISNGTLRASAFNEAANYTDTSTICVSASRKAYAVLQPVLLIPGYVAGYYSPTGLPINVGFSGIFRDSQGSIFPQYCAFGTCPSFKPYSSTDPNLDDTAIALIASFGSLFLLGCFCIVVFVFLFFFGIKWQGRRRVYEVQELEEMLKSKIPVNEEGWSYREIDPKDLEFDQVLGIGAFGKVYKGSWRGADVAIKTLENVSLSNADKDVINEIRSEAQIMTQLGNHPNIVSFIGAVTKSAPNEDNNNNDNNNREEQGDEEEGIPALKNTLCLVLEYCPRGSLFDCLIKQREKIPFVTLVRMARDAANGILHLHKEKIIHRDIAARNILLGQNYEVYISDFGMARLKQTDTHTTHSNIGPIAWMAPESMIKREYSEASDAFSFGVLLWEMVSKKVPWRGMQGVQIVIAVAKENTRLKIPNDCDPIIRNIILSVWKVKPEKRMSMKEIWEKLNTYYERLRILYEGMDSPAGEESMREDGQSTRFAFARSIGLSSSQSSMQGDVGTAHQTEDNDEEEEGSSSDDKDEETEEEEEKGQQRKERDGLQRQKITELVYSEVDTTKRRDGEKGEEYNHDGLIYSNLESAQKRRKEREAQETEKEGEDDKPTNKGSLVYSDVDGSRIQQQSRRRKKKKNKQESDNNNNKQEGSAQEKKSTGKRKKAIGMGSHFAFKRIGSSTEIEPTSPHH